MLAAFAKHASGARTACTPQCLSQGQARFCDGERAADAVLQIERLPLIDLEQPVELAVPASQVGRRA